MLYVTTRSNRDAFTAQRVLRENRGPDGGLFIPLQDPQFSPEEIQTLQQLSFSQCVAHVLNKLFHTHITYRDIDLAVGRYPVRMKRLNQRLIVGECWHNLEFSMPYLVKNINSLLRSDNCTGVQPGEWTSVAVRTAVIFGMFAELMRNDIVSVENPADVSVVSGDFAMPISLYYCRKWGLPVGNIICCCNENGGLWDFVCHGQLKTDSVAKQTCTPDADIVVPGSLERLIYAGGGVLEVERYLEAVRSGRTYYLDDKTLHSMRQGIYVTVNGEQRIFSAIAGVFATHRYLLSPYSALAYVGLQDYRSRTGENKSALLICEKSAACDIKTVSAAIGLGEAETVCLLDSMQ